MFRKNMNKTISVITPTYNQAQYLDDCITSVSASIVAPTQITIEHIVVNDGSTDHTDAICRKHPHIHYIPLKQNQGGSVALNTGIHAASGKYIFVLDSDDVLLQRTLYNFYSALEADEAAEWAYSDFIRSDESLRYRLQDDYYGWRFSTPKEMLTAIFEGQHFLQHNVMYTRELFIKAGGYDEQRFIAKDLDLFIRFLLLGKLPLYIPITSHIHRFHDTNISIGHDGAKHLANVAQLQRTYDYPAILEGSLLE